MGLRARWTLALVAAALVLVTVLGVGVDVARQTVAGEARATWRAEREALVHAALSEIAVSVNTVLENPLVRDELGDILAFAQAGDASADRVLSDWATRCVTNTAAEEVLVMDAEGRLVSSAPWAAGAGRVHPRAGELLDPLPGTVVVYDARVPGEIDDAGWVVAIVRSLRVDEQPLRLAVGRRLDADVLEDVARATQIRALRWGAPAAGRGEVPLALPAGWRPGFGAHLVWNPGEPVTLRAFDTMRRWIVFAGLAALGVALLGAPWIAAGLGRPLEQMAAAVSAIGRGARHPDLPRSGPREIRTLRDAIVQMTRDLGAAENRIREAERRAAWREIARRIAHEIRNALSPLSLAVDNVETAARRDDETAQAALRSSLRIARDQLGSLERLIGEFGDFARQPRLEIAPLDVRDLLEAAVGAVRAARADVDFRLDASAAPDSVQGDVEQLRRAVHNLLVNAADAAPAATVELVASGTDDPDRWSIEIRDRGPGPADAVLERLGEPYLTTKETGTGLGLPITIRIAEAHGGRFTLARRDGGGAVARLDLPRVVPATEDGEGGPR